MFRYWTLRKNKVHKFIPKVSIELEKGPYRLRTVANVEDLVIALKLRYQVFHQDLISKKNLSGVLVDDIDFLSDHYLVEDKRSQKVISSYRMNSSLFSKNFASEKTFHLRHFLDNPGVKTELGRACIEKNSRNSLVQSLLWQGIAGYLLKTNSSYLFACASISTESSQAAALLHKYFLEQNRFHRKFLCPPRGEYSMPKIELWQQFYRRDLSTVDKEEAQSFLPTLFKTFLSAGSYIGGEPAYDAELKCIDFLTILDRENLNKALWRSTSQWQMKGPMGEMNSEIKKDCQKAVGT